MPEDCGVNRPSNAPISTAKPLSATENAPSLNWNCEVKSGIPKSPMYQYYIGIADSVGDLSGGTYRYATDIQEVRRYLKGVTGEDISLENLYLTPDGKIGGLPDKAADLINKTKDNAKIERMKDALVDIIGKIRISGDLGIPDFTSQFQFKDGAFSVADFLYLFPDGAIFYPVHGHIPAAPNPYAHTLYVVTGNAHPLQILNEII